MAKIRNQFVQSLKSIIIIIGSVHTVAFGIALIKWVNNELFINRINDAVVIRSHRDAPIPTSLPIQPNRTATVLHA